MNMNNLNAIIEENETFIGTDLDSEKMARLNAMRELCEKITVADPRIINTPLPVLDTNKHAGVRLEIPALLFTAKEDAIHALGELFRLSDAVTIVAKDGEKVKITCDVQDMWKTNTNKPGHDLWHVTAVYTKNKAFVYKFTVNAETDADAHTAANNRLPDGYVVASITRD